MWNADMTAEISFVTSERQATFDGPLISRIIKSFVESVLDSDAYFVVYTSPMTARMESWYGTRPRPWRSP